MSRQSSQAWANFLLLAGLVTSCASMLLPEATSLQFRGLLRDSLTPALQITEPTANWISQTSLPLFNTPKDQSVPDGSVEIHTTNDSIERLQREIVTLKAKLQNRHHERRATQTASLFEPALVNARRLLPEQAQAWRTGHWISGGRRAQISEHDWIVRSEEPLIDVGADFELQADQLILAGRQIIGQVDQVGLWSSTYRPVHSTDFRCQAQVMNRGTGQRHEDSSGSLHGNGGELCELKYIENTTPVSEGDYVVLADPARRFSGPLILGKVVSATVQPNTPFWDIRVQPAQPHSQRQVHIITERLNPVRLPNQP